MDYGIRACLSRTYGKFIKSRELVIRDSHEVTSVKIVRLKNRRNRFRKKWLKEKTASNFVNLVRESRKLRKEVRRVRKNVIRSNMSKSPKHFWSEINKLRGIQRNEVDKMELNGEITTDIRKISDSFINFFTNKVNNLLTNYVPYKPRNIDNISQIEFFTTEEVDRALSRLSNKKSSGMDGLSGFFIKIFTKILAPVLKSLFNKILTTGEIPSTWKIAKIVPVHKKGDTSKVDNFRPVSNIVSIAKVFELTILQRLERMNQDMLVGGFQHGFRKDHGTDTAIAEVVNYISEARDEKECVAVYSADLTAAFDLLQKEKLVQLLKRKGVPDYLVRVIHSYLDKRVGYVQIKNVRSCVHEILAGCVQGSILGPVLFNIYMSELDEIVSPHKIVSYADDSYVIIKAKNQNLLVNELRMTLEKHFSWLGEMGMKCNMTKTELIIFDSDELEIDIRGTTVKSSESMKMLGMIVDKRLTWEMHMHKTIAKIRSIIFSLRYVRKNLSLSDTLKVVRAQVVSRLTYGSPAWSNVISYKLRAKLKSVFYLVLRTVIRDFQFKMNRRTLSRVAKIEDIEVILFKRTSVFLFNIINNLTPTNLAGMMLSRAYFNERQPNRVFFTDQSRTKAGKISLLNSISNYTTKWDFDWLGLTKNEFKNNLRALNCHIL